MTEPALPESLHSYRRLLGYAWRYRWVLLLSGLGMVGLAVTSTTFVALTKPLVDGGLVARDQKVIALIPVTIIALFAFRGVVSFIAEYGIKWVGRKIVFDIRNDMFLQLMRLPCAFYDATASGTLIAKLIFDVEQLSKAATQAWMVVARDGFTIIGIVAWMSYLNWKLTLLLGVLTPAAGLVIRVMSRRMRKASHLIQRSVGELSRVAHEATAAQRVVKAFGAEQVEAKSFAAVNEKNRRQFMRRVAVAELGLSITIFLVAIAIAVVLWAAVRSGEASAGEFVSYVVAMLWLMQPVRRLVQVNEVLQTGIAAAQSAFALIDESAERDLGTTVLAQVRGKVEYRAVEFSYPLAAVPALRGVSFAISPGEVVALVGASGSGKSTVAALLPRFYPVSAGEILIDGVNISDLRLANLRGAIAVVGQETLLFDDSIRNNIAYGAPGPIDDQRISRAVKAGHVAEFADRLPEGLDTMVGEQGLRLSGGQRQRIAIARALYKDAPILVLDEATSALDSESERLVQDALQELVRNRSTLVIAHRLATIERADRILVLAHGRIVESGRHAELLALGGVYASLYRTQFNEPPN